MIIGSGIDIIDSGRMRRELAAGAWTPEQGVFTADEILFCDRDCDSALLYSALFAAKEATLKALNIEVPNLSRFREVEVLPDPKGKLALSLQGHVQTVSRELGVRRLALAVTTSAGLSGAVVLLES